jgi:hypothetical protein
MSHLIKNVKYLEDYKLELQFKNRITKIVDLSDMLKHAKNMLLPLKDIEYFKQVSCDGITICWPNGVDLCPDVLYEMGTLKPKRKSTVRVSKSRKKLKA